MSNDQTGEKQDDKKKALGWGQQETVYMSNNINPFTVMPLAPNQVSGGQLTPNILVDTIGAYTTGGTIQLLADLNAEYPAEFKFNNQTIYPYEVYNPNGTSIANCGTDNTNGTFTVSLNGYPQLLMTNGDTVFQYADPRNYNVIIDGFLTTSNSVGIGQPATTAHALSVSGDVLITGKVNLAGVQLANLGIATAVAPGYVFDVSGNSILRGTTTFTKNTYVQGFLGIGKTSATVALDVSGSSAISNNISVTRTTFTNRLGIGKLSDWTAPYVMDISGNTRMTGSLAVSTNIDVSRNMVVARSVTISGQGVALTDPTLNVVGNIQYSTNLSGKSATLTSNVSILGKVGIGKTDVPNYALQVWGDEDITGNLTASNIVASSVFATGNGAFVTALGPNSYFNTSYLAVGLNQEAPVPDPTYVMQLSGIAHFGSRTTYAQIALNMNNPQYELDMSGTLNTTILLSSNITTASLKVSDVSASNIDASNIYVGDIYGIANNINIHNTIVNDSAIYTPRLCINDPFSTPDNTVSIIGPSKFSGNITQTSGYLLAPTKITRIQYNSAGANSGPPINLPGYWSLSGTTVTLYLDTYPVMYVLDGSNSNTNMTVQIQSDSQLRTGVNYSFVARRTSGAGHTIQYPYSSGLTYSKTLASPLSFPLLCIGTDDYSST